MYSSTYEEAQPIAGFALDNSVDALTRKSFAKAQMGIEIPLRSASGYILPNNPWPKTAEVVNKDTAFAVAKKKRYSHRQEQGNSWAQKGDSSSSASASATAKEVADMECKARVRGSGTHAGADYSKV